MSATSRVKPAGEFMMADPTKCGYTGPLSIATVVTAPLLRMTFLMAAFPVSDTNANNPSGETAMPRGLLNLAEAPFPSALPDTPLPPAKVDTDLVVDEITRMAWLYESATISDVPSGTIPSPTGALNCAEVPAPSEEPETALFPAKVSTYPVLMTILRSA
jgi:hypothetical protein